jgi:hypothetical protein
MENSITHMKVLIWTILDFENINNSKVGFFYKRN